LWTFCWKTFLFIDNHGLEVDMAKMHHFAPFLVFSFLIFCACDRMNEADKIKALRKAEKVTETVRRKVRASEKAEGKQDLVKDKVSLKRSARGRPFIEQTGEASSYGQEFHGKTTASGEKFDKNKLTAAHPTLPLGTTAKVTNLENGRSVEVRINDRGPHVKGRDIDVSLGAAKKLAITESGVAPVKIEATLPPS
jgi:rare lipoprotein A (peptidoglycan hydrolase)